jgi:hypothetical protein
MYMPKLNAVAMVVLTLGVIAGTGYFVLRRPVGAPDAVVSQKLLRSLADRDPDVSSEAATALRTMGSKAIPALEEASRSANPLLAERAQKVLAGLKPAPAPLEAAIPEKTEIMEFALESRGGPAKAADLGALWVQFRNSGPAPVLLAHGPTLDHPTMALFEIEDGEGRKTEATAEVIHLKTGDFQEIVAVGPRETVMLFQGGLALVQAVSKPGTYKIRFAYDATEESDYRNLVQPSAEGVLLPPIRLVSNTVTVTVAD